MSAHRPILAVVLSYVCALVFSSDSTAAEPLLLKLGKVSGVELGKTTAEDVVSRFGRAKYQEQQVVGDWLPVGNHQSSRMFVCYRLKEADCATRSNWTVAFDFSHKDETVIYALGLTQKNFGSRCSDTSKRVTDFVFEKPWGDFRSITPETIRQLVDPRYSSSFTEFRYEVYERKSSDTTDVTVTQTSKPREAGSAHSSFSIQYLVKNKRISQLKVGWPF